MKSEEIFYLKYKQEPERIIYCPYRICPVGAHIDHQLGNVTGFAIDRGIQLAYKSKQNGVIELTSLQFEKRAQFHVNSIPPVKENDWADYLRGAALFLGKKYNLSIGLAGVIEGNFPIGGLSSSAAVTIVFLRALANVNHITLTLQELADLAREAENKYVGVACGRLDQGCEIYSKKNHLLHINIRENQFDLLPMSKHAEPWKVAVVFSGLERSLSKSKYNVRVDEVRCAAYALRSYAGEKNAVLHESCLGNISEELFLKYKERLPFDWQKRCMHFYSEQKRVALGIEAWKNGNMKQFGRLVEESGRSSIDSWETGSRELIELHNIINQTDGVYGGRFSGAGFKGSCIAFIHPDYEQSIIRTIQEKYLRSFPELKSHFTVRVCESADGVFYM